MRKGVTTAAATAAVFVQCALGASTASAQSAYATSDARVKELLAAVAPATTGATTSPDATGLQPAAAAAPTESVTLGLEEAVALALERNLDIAVERLNPLTLDLSLASLRATFLPTVNSTLGLNKTVDLPRNQLTGGNRVINDLSTFNFGVAETLPWGGGSLALGWQNRRLESTNSFNTFNPQFNTTLTGSLIQPLLRNRQTDSLRTQLRVTQINRNISELQLRTTVTNTLAQVRSAYWDLVYAIDSVIVARRSLELAEKLLDDNKIRVEVGTMAPIDVVQAEAEVATRNQVLAQVEATARTAELSLKRLIVGGTDDPRWRARLSPTDRPSFKAEGVDIEAALRAALDKRTDLAESRRTLEINDLSVRLLRNQKLPAADLVASYGLQGIGGTQFIRDSNLGGQITGTIPGGYGDALSWMNRGDYPSWNVQMQFSYPIGQSAADANYARARLNVRQTQAQMKALELQIATEVTNAALQVESTLKQVAAATAARELAQRRLEAESSKFEVGLSTNFFVVQAQRDLSDAQNAELRSQLDYRKSLVDFERVQETSLAGAGITVVAAGGIANQPRANAAGAGGGGGGGGA